jgi:hypothetical protein
MADIDGTDEAQCPFSADALARNVREILDMERS